MPKPNINKIDHEGVAYRLLLGMPPIEDKPGDFANISKKGNK